MQNTTSQHLSKTIGRKSRALLQRLLFATLISMGAVTMVSCGGGGSGAGTAPPGSSGNSGTSGLTNSFGESVGSDGGFGAGDAGADGTAGQGAPLVGATITVSDATGRSVTVVTDARGYYAAKVTSFTAPLVAKVQSSDGKLTYYSVSTTPVASGTFVTMNITGLTDKVVSDAVVAAGGTGAAAVAINGPVNFTTQPNFASNLATAKANLRTTLRAQLTAAGLNATTFDPVTQVFRADKTGYDAVLDTTLVTRNGTGTTQITPDGQQPVAGLDTSGIAIFVNDFNRLNKLQTTRESAAFADLIDVDYLDKSETKAIFLSSFINDTGTLAGNLTNVSFKNCNASTSVCDFHLTFVQSNGNFSNSTTQKVKLTAGVWRLYGDRVPVQFDFKSVLQKNVASSGSGTFVTTYIAGYNFYLQPTDFASAKIEYTVSAGGTTSAPVELMRLIATKAACTTPIGTPFMLTDNGNANDCSNFAAKTDAQLSALNSTFATGVVNLIVTGYSAGNYTGTATTFTVPFTQVLRLASEGPATLTPVVTTPLNGSGSGPVTSANFTVPAGFDTDNVLIEVKKQVLPGPIFLSGRTRFGGTSLAALNGTVSLAAAYNTCVAGGGTVPQCTGSYGPADNAQISGIFVFGRDASGRGIWTSYAYPFQ